MNQVDNKYFFKLKYCSRNNWFDYEPDEIFHFTKLSSVESIMNSNSLRFRKNNYSNDDRDGKIYYYVISAIDSIDSNQLNDTSHWLEFSGMIKSFIELYEHLNLTMRSNDTFLSLPTMYNLCFSTKNNNHMWSKYGNYGKGVAIGFSKSYLKRFLDYPFEYNVGKYFDCTCGKVIYDEISKHEIIEDIILNAYNDYCSLVLPDLKKDCLEEIKTELLLCSYFFKAPSWHEDNEFRFILLHIRSLIPPEIDDFGNRFIQFNFNDTDNLKKYAITKLSVKCESYIDSFTKYNVNCVLSK